MKRKISTFKEVQRTFPPHTITLASGSFEPFNEYYFRFLHWASRQNRPLVVIVQKDDMVLIRRGFVPLSTTHKTRAEILSSLEFVDRVVVANRTAHDKKSIEQLRPKVVALQNDSPVYRKMIGEEIRQSYPKVGVKIVPFRSQNFATKNKHGFAIKTIGNKIAGRLLSLAERSEGRVSKISAILVNSKNRILAQAANSTEEEHAEILLLRRAKLEKINLKQCWLYVLIPPCLMCAREIAKNGVKQVLYLLPYGDGKGISYLAKNGIRIKNCR